MVPRAPTTTLATEALIVTGLSRIHMSTPPPSSVAATHEIGPPLVNTTATSPEPSPEAVRRSADSTREVNVKNGSS